MSLKPVKTPGSPTRFKTYDLEWYPDTYQHRLTGCYDGRTWRPYRRVGDFLNAELVSENSGTLYFAHAGGLADVQFLLEQWLRNPRGIEIEASFSGSSAIIVRVTRDRHTWTFCDSFWLMRDSLEKIGKSIGVTKLGEEWRCQRQPCGHEPGQCIYWAPIDVLEEYNEVDCRILWLAIRRMEQELLELGGELKMTVASCAMRLFRGRFLKREIDTSEYVNARAREGYVASRVEPFRRHMKGPAYLFDINSSFPYSMTEPLPGAVRWSGRRFREKELSICHAKVTVKPAHIPPIPYKVDGRVYFPTGTWEGWFTGVDLLFLLEAGGRIHWTKKCYEFDAFTELGDYVRTIYELRKESKDEFRRIVYKYLMNALYGKFAERREKDGLVVFKPAPKGAVNIEEIFPGALYYERESTVFHEWVPISEIITARSRRLLTRGLWEVGDAGYCDTDSIMTNRNVMKTGPELGQFKLEAEIGEGEDAEFLAPKLYRFGRKVRAKGFSLPRFRDKKRQEEEQLRHFARIAAGEAVPIQRMMRIREVLRSGDLAPRDLREEDGNPRMKQVRLKEKPKRFFYPDGSSRAWDVSEL